MSRRMYTADVTPVRALASITSDDGGTYRHCNSPLSVIQAAGSPRAEWL